MIQRQFSDEDLLGKRVKFSFSPGLVLTGVVLYIYNRDEDGNPASVIVERKDFGRLRPDTVKVEWITEIN